jgi:hypothetical protein
MVHVGVAYVLCAIFDDVEATIRHGKMEQIGPVAVVFMKPDVIAYE